MGFRHRAQVNFTKAIDDNRQFPDDFGRFFGSRFDRDKNAPAPALGLFKNSVYMTPNTHQQMGQSRLF
jgi:hypothetical protein